VSGQILTLSGEGVQELDGSGVLAVYVAPTERARMRFVTTLLSLLLLAGCATASKDVRPPVDATELVGTWKVDLRPTPGAPPYFQDLVVSSVQGKTFTGTFYGAPVEQARINTDWGAVRIAFVTSDASGPYNHSATLVGTRLEGLTNSTGRDFLSFWTATRP
jgi:hypothetical protein